MCRGAADAHVQGAPGERAQGEAVPAAEEGRAHHRAILATPPHKEPQRLPQLGRMKGGRGGGGGEGASTDWAGGRRVLGVSVEGSG